MIYSDAPVDDPVQSALCAPDLDFESDEYIDIDIDAPLNEWRCKGF